MGEHSRPPADMPAEEIIESWLPRAFAAAARRPPPDSPSVRVTLSGPGGGTWDVCVSEDALTVERREPGARHGDPDIWLRQSANDYLAFFRDDPDLPALLPPDTDVMDLLCVDEGKLDLLAHIDGRIAVEIQGRRRRRWGLDVAFGPSGMRAGRPRSTVRVDSRTCEELSNGALAALQALVAGRLQVEGDRALVMQVVMLAGSVQRSRIL
ncbi:MAG TPA: SCP2 sterol-binding domain-containing protein [Polyangia bacterium]|nr:SCP2 sterol-binding domain-containing protein [Polyangia bacterium]